MQNFDPRLIVLFCLLFIGLGAFSIFTGRRRMLEARAQGQRIVWFKQVGILTGIEYILLAFTFLISISINAGWLPKSWSQFLVPFYIVILLASLLLAGLVLFQSISASRRNRQTQPTRSSAPTRTSSPVERPPKRVISAEERASQVQKRRDRRQKAAQTRRRRAGKT